MQKFCTELTEKLLKSLDKDYNVIDMGTVVDVITALEKTTITKEVLEITRLGKYINELRRKTNNDVLARRAKDLVRRWRDMVLPSTHTILHSISADSTSLCHALNGSTKPLSPSAKNFLHQNPIVTRVTNPQSPLFHDVLSSKVMVSPSLSHNIDSSGSPNSAPVIETMVSHFATNSTSSAKLIDATNQNHLLEAVPRTHSSNKRLRKDDHQHSQYSRYLGTFQQEQQRFNVNLAIRDEFSIIKKQRVNGDNLINNNSHSQVPSPSSSTMIERNVLNISNDRKVTIGGPKKRGRKKGSKSFKNQLIPEDRVKEKLACISRNPKLKTTQELLADLQARGSHTFISANVVSISTHSFKKPNSEFSIASSAIRNTNIPDISNVIVHHEELSSTNPCQSCVADINIMGTKNVSSMNLTVKEILAKLPPLDIDSIRWSDEEMDNRTDMINDNTNNLINSQKRITDADIDRLHQMSIESVNGNFQLKLKNIDGESVREMSKLEAMQTMEIHKRQAENETNEEFREWHEMIAKPSYNGQILHILPYVIID